MRKVLVLGGAGDMAQVALTELGKEEGKQEDVPLIVEIPEPVRNRLKWRFRPNYGIMGGKKNKLKERRQRRMLTGCLKNDLHDIKNFTLFKKIPSFFKKREGKGHRNPP